MVSNSPAAWKKDPFTCKLKKKKIEIIQVKKKIENKIKNYLEVIENG